MALSIRQIADRQKPSVILMIQSKTFLLKSFPIFLASVKTLLGQPVAIMLLGVCMLNGAGCSVPRARVSGMAESGAGFFHFEDKTIPGNMAMRVFYYKPKKYNADRPILFFMHGADRKVEHIPKIVAETIETINILLILPEFSEELFPTIESYQYGNVRTKPKALWSYYVNDRIFKRVRQLTGSSQKKYYIWGNSAGAQFVHRQVLVGAHEFIEKAFVSNAGVYTLPIEGDDPYPYSIKGLGLTNGDLKKMFRLSLFVLLGEQDVMQDAYFLKSRAAMKQGVNRFQRGKLFYATAENAALNRGLEFNWRLITIPGCGHTPDTEMLNRVIGAIFDSGE